MLPVLVTAAAFLFLAAVLLALAGHRKRELHEDMARRYRRVDGAPPDDGCAWRG